MILKKITIENFRCFKNYEVDLTPGITVFIGKNGAGKTSLLNAIRYGLSVFFSNDSTMGDDLLSLILLQRILHRQVLPCVFFR